MTQHYVLHIEILISFSKATIAGTVYTFNILFTKDFLMCADRSHM